MRPTLADILALVPLEPDDPYGRRTRAKCVWDAVRFGVVKEDEAAGALAEAMALDAEADTARSAAVRKAADAPGGERGETALRPSFDANSDSARARDYRGR